MSSSDHPRERRISSDSETIREWADRHDSIPVRGGDGETDRYRFVRESEVGSTHERADWDTFFSDIEEGDYVVIHRGEEADEPFEVVRRDEALTRLDLEDEAVEARLLEGETVTSEITETTVVEQTIVEHATVESKLVDTTIVDQNVVDIDLLRRECTNCDLVADRNVDARDIFDSNRYYETIGAEGHDTGERMDVLGPDGELPYHAELDVEEAWTVIREIEERLTVESRIVEEDVSETDTVLDRDVDVQGLQRTIVESDIFDADMSADEVLKEYDVETDFSEGETIRTYFDRQRMVEDEVVDRRRLRADIVEGELLGMETIHTEDIAESTSGGKAAAMDGSNTRTAETVLSDDEMGKTVVDASGDEVGMVTGVDDSGEVMYVEAHPSITERIKAALDWGDSGDDDYSVGVEQIERVSDERVELKGAEELEKHR